jgi:choline dehydrogenase-like flavoprotein
VLVDARQLEPGTGIEADVCIVGAGAAGITLARDLGRAGLRVALLESGDFLPSLPSTDLNRGRSIGLRYGPLHMNRLRQFGGTTGHWSGWCRPLDPEDLAGAGRQQSWPIAWDELARWYPRAAETVQIPSAWKTADLARGSGHKLMALDPTRVTTTHYILSPPTRFGELYREELAESPNVTVYLHANLVNIALAREDDRVEALEVATLEGRTFRARARRYVLAAGGLENARLLLISRDRSPDGLGNRSGYVGRFFMEHPHYRKAAYLVVDPQLDLGFYRYHHGLPGVDGTQGPWVIGALTPSSDWVRCEGIPRLACTLTPEDLAALDREQRTGRIPAADVAQLTLGTPKAALYSLFVRSAQAALTESRVFLDGERDALGLPRLALEWRTEPDARESVTRFLRLLGAEVARAGLGRLWIDENRWGRLATVLEGGSHHMGTTRMSASAKDGVVDERCRLHECPELYIAGSSVFPSVGFANPTLTLVALAHRMAEDLRRELA